MWPAAHAPPGSGQQSALLQALLQTQQQPLEREWKAPPPSVLALTLALQQAAAPPQVAQAHPSLPAWQQQLLELGQQRPPPPPQQQRQQQQQQSGQLLMQALQSLLSALPLPPQPPPQPPQQPPPPPQQQQQPHGPQQQT
jgi:hypothetical protein